MPLEGVPKAAGIGRTRHVLHDPGSHGVQEHRGLEIGPHAQQGSVGIGPGDGSRGADGPLRIVGHVEHDHVGLVFPDPIQVRGIEGQRRRRDFQVDADGQPGILDRLIDDLPEVVVRADQGRSKLLRLDRRPLILPAVPDVRIECIHTVGHRIS